jgi:hypothetical protein
LPKHWKTFNVRHSLFPKAKVIQPAILSTVNISKLDDNADPFITAFKSEEAEN